MNTLFYKGDFKSNLLKWMVATSHYSNRTSQQGRILKSNISDESEAEKAFYLTGAMLAAFFVRMVVRAAIKYLIAPSLLFASYEFLPLLIFVATIWFGPIVRLTTQDAGT